MSSLGSLGRRGVATTKPIVDLRSDTVTQPSAAVRTATAQAVVGDDVYGEDPTANRLEQHMAELLGKEAGLLLPTGTMGNLTALAASMPRRGEAVLLGRESHIYSWEQGGASSLLGLPMRPMPEHAEHPGELCLTALEAELAACEDVHIAPIGLVALENTHATSSGRALSRSYTEKVGELCRRHRVPLHIDGARFFNAATVLAVNEGVGMTEALQALAAPASTVSICLSKALSAPMGSILVGDARTIHAARRARKLFGGGMRQIGMMAAASMAALDENVHRLHEDHRLAEQLAQGLAAIPGVKVTPRQADATNMVIFEIESRVSKTDEQLLAALRERHGVRLGYGYVPGTLRAVTHRDISLECVERALAGLRAELA